MSHPSPSNRGRTPADSATASSNLTHSLSRLSINAASNTPLPPSSQPSSPARPAAHRTNSASSPSARTPRSPALHRSPSSMSINEARSSTPTLLRKASMNSLHGIGSASRSSSRADPSRRSSSASFLNASTMVGKSPITELEDVVETPRHTARSIANEHFKKELELHNEKNEARPTDTIVILHDACYGHRYSRPRATKAALSTIVERPERIHASILGLSVAYVRLGDRHVEGKHPPHPKHDPAAIPTTPFRIRKTTRRLALSNPAVTNVHGVKWMEELKIMCENAEAKLAMNGKELTRPEMDRSPGQQAPEKFHEGDLYLCSESLNAMEGAMGAVCEGVDAVFKGSSSGTSPHRTFVVIRPPGHHCSDTYPSGFCWVNNVHVGINHAALAHGLTHAAIIDFDLHHGDGSQAITWAHNARANNLPKNAMPWKKTSIGYFSLHDINSYPCEQGDEEKVKNASLCIENAHGQNIWNVHLYSWKSESEFWDLYETKYSVLLEKTRNYLRTQTERLRQVPNGQKPKAAIFLSAGFDASEWESSGMQRHKVNVPTEFYARLTRDVVKLAAEEGTAVDGRVISVLEGGYSDRALCTGVFSHLSGLAGGDPIIVNREISPNGLAYEMGQRIGAYNGVETPKTEPVNTGARSYDPSWWSLPFLEQLDSTVSPPPPPAEPKKPKADGVPTFSAPTQSFINKVHSPRTQRRVSDMNGNNSPKARPLSPPPPPVDWTVAAHELSKLLIPTDRQTQSCKPEDLSAEATRARRDRQSILTPPNSNSGSEGVAEAAPRMALRTRKPAKPAIETVVEDDKKLAAKAARRKTVAGPGVIAAEKASSKNTTPTSGPGFAQPTKQSGRRLSVASNSGSILSEAPANRPAGPSRAASGSAILPPRPGSSQSVRPGSSMSSKGQPAPIAVKKTRAPAQPRNDTTKVARVRQKSPLTEKSATGKERAGPVVPQRNTSTTLPPANSSKASSADVDALTSGMKKIKINLVTKAQKEAREREQAAAAKQSQMSSQNTINSRPLAPSPPKPEPQIQGNPPISISQSSPENIPSLPMPSTPQSPLPPHIPSRLANASHIPLPTSSPAQTSPTLAPTNSANDVFIPYQPEGPPPATMVQQDSLKWLPPNTATPSPMKRQDLPVFTATSTIPFGLAPTAAPAQTQGPVFREAKDESRTGPVFDQAIWNIPETPKK